MRASPAKLALVGYGNMGRLIERLAPDTWAERYPTLTRISQEGAFDQADADGESPYTVQEAITAFEHGLRLMLDGVEALIATRL